MILRVFLSFCILIVPVFAQAQERAGGLPPDVLASCIQRAEALDRIDGALRAERRRAAVIWADVQELRLRIGSIAPTAVVDPSIRTELHAYWIEVRAAETALRALRAAEAERLEARRVEASGYALLCAGQGYSDADHKAALELLGR